MLPSSSRDPYHHLRTCPPALFVLSVLSNPNRPRGPARHRTSPPISRTPVDAHDHAHTLASITPEAPAQPSPDRPSPASPDALTGALHATLCPLHTSTNPRRRSSAPSNSQSHHALCIRRDSACATSARIPVNETTSTPRVCASPLRVGPPVTSSIRRNRPAVQLTPPQAISPVPPPPAPTGTRARAAPPAPPAPPRDRLAPVRTRERLDEARAPSINRAGQIRGPRTKAPRSGAHRTASRSQAAHPDSGWLVVLVCAWRLGT